MNPSLGKFSFSDVAIAAAVLALGAALGLWIFTKPVKVEPPKGQPSKAIATYSACSGGNPGSLAFDGRHIWVTCNGTNEIQEFNTSDGSRIASVTQLFADSQYHGLILSRILYDGAHIWVSASNKSDLGAVVRINLNALTATAKNSVSCASMGPAGCTYFMTGSGASGLAFDGANIWVANSGSDNLTRIASDGSTTTLTPNTECIYPVFPVFDGANLWVPCRRSDSVQVWQLIGGSQQTVLTAAGIEGPTSLATDGVNMWVASEGGTVNLISRASPFTISPAFTLPSSTSGGLAFDGKYMWVADYSHDQVTKLLPAAKPSSVPTVVETYLAGSSPESPVFDGQNIWVANSGSNTLSKF